MVAMAPLFLKMVLGQIKFNCKTDRLFRSAPTRRVPGYSIRDAKMKTFTVTKKNRKYFAATLENNTACKILIDENSQDLDLGTHTLDLDDISVRSKYGVDLIFKLAGSVQAQADAGICTLRHARFNAVLVNSCRQLGGKWDADEKAWVFSGFVAAEVEDLDALYNSALVTVDIVSPVDVSQWQGPVLFVGYPIAKATGRDSGAKLCDDVAKIEGTVTSGGSAKNWTTKVMAGTVLRMQVPSALLPDVGAGTIGEFNYTVLS